MKEFLEMAKKIEKETIAHRRYLHENAEVGFTLPKTTAYITKTLRGYGYAPRRLKKGGVVAEIYPKDRGRDEFILLRADVDGLPMQEESGLPYACTSGNMHACGHDLHAAALLSAAKLLQNNPPPYPVRLLFQAAEEILEGGEYAVKAGVCKGVKAAFSLHVLSGLDLQTGQILFSPQGVVAPSADTFEITLTGKSCHGAMPHQGVDATAAATAITQAFHHLVSHELPIGEGLLTVGYLQSGDGANILAGKARLKGSCRATDEVLRKRIKSRIREIVGHISSAYGTRSSVRFYGGCPSLLQDGELLEKAKVAFIKAFGEEKITTLGEGTKKMGGAEDFAYISRAVPSLLVSIAAAQEGGGLPLHHPRLVFDEAALPVCVAAYTAFAHLW